MPDEERRRRVTDYTKADIELLQQLLQDNTRQLHVVTQTLAQFAPKTEVDEAIRREVAGLGERVEDALQQLQDATNNAHTAATLASATVFRVQAAARTAQRRLRLLSLATVSATAAAIFLALMGGVTMVDLHTHLGHVRPIEARVTEIEDYINAVIESRPEENYPPLGHHDRYVTGDNPPMYPSPEQQVPPVGVFFYGIFGTLMLATVGLALRLWRLANRDPLTNGASP